MVIFPAGFIVTGFPRANHPCQFVVILFWIRTSGIKSRRYFQNKSIKAKLIKSGRKDDDVMQLFHTRCASYMADSTLFSIKIIFLVNKHGKPNMC